MFKVIFIGLFFLFFSFQALAEKKMSLTLSESIGRALDANDEIKMKDEDVHTAEGRLAEIKSLLYPTIQMTTLAIPIYKEIGDALTSVDDKNEWGAWLKSTTTIFQPLYGFRKEKYFKLAGEKGIEAEKEQRQMKKAEVIFDVKQYYYSAQAAYDAMKQLDETEEKLQGVIKRVDELLKMESGEVRKQDAYKLKALHQELKQKKEFVIKGSKLAAAAVAFKAGISSETEFDIQDKNLKKEDFVLKSLEFYQNLAMENRPEMKALKAGITARHALIDGERTNRLPLFFLGGLVDLADTPNDIRPRQGSPYAYDPYNSSNVGLGLGFRWNLDVWKVNAKIKSLKAEYYKLVHQKDFAEKGIPLEVKKAYLEYKEALANIGHASEQLSHSKKWFLQSAVAWGFGVGDTREVLESVIFKGLSDKNYFEAMLNHNIAIGALSKATGTELLSHLKY
ncbi:MAG: TolC family protein [Deltaproteobacteria bacterium]|nr:TolC family protein [Deltaproteobacteria bacterium]